MTAIPARATLDDLYRTPGKAELIGGKVVQLVPSGDLPTDVAGELYVSLRLHAKATGVGVAKTDGVGYAVPELPSGRESFSPDASYYAGQRPANPMRYLEGPPTFAAEVRSENDYGNAAEDELADKRVDYFAAGTLVVWDVDPLAATVTVYRGDARNPVAVFHRGDTADAEPAVPGWRIAVDAIFA